MYNTNLNIPLHTRSSVERFKAATNDIETSSTPEQCPCRQAWMWLSLANYWAARSRQTEHCKQKVLVPIHIQPNLVQCGEPTHVLPHRWKGLEVQCLQHVAAQKFGRCVVFFLELSIVLLCTAVSPHRPHLTWRTWRGSNLCVELEKMWPSSPWCLYDEQKLEGKQGLPSDVQQVGHNVVPW